MTENNQEPDFVLMTDKTEYIKDLGFKFKFEEPYLWNIQTVIDMIYKLKAFIHDDSNIQIQNQWLLSLEILGWNEKSLREKWGLQIHCDKSAGHYLKMLINGAIIGFNDIEPVLSFSTEGDDEQYVSVRMKVSEMLEWLKTQGKGDIFEGQRDEHV